jgi:hypothetical protein
MCLLVVAPALCFAQQTTGELGGRYWVTNSTQRLKLTQHGVGTDIDLKSDLGFKDRNFPEVRFNWYSKRRSKLMIDYFQVGYEGDKDVERTVAFSGATYTLGTRVVSNLDIRQVKMGWAYQFVNVAGGKFKLGTLLAGHGLFLDASLSAPNLRTPLKQSDKLAAGFPTVGLALDVNPDRKVNLAGDFSGITVGKYGYTVDGELALKFMPVRHLGLTLGYRGFRVNPKFEPDFAIVRISGPFAGASLRF